MATVAWTCFANPARPFQDAVKAGTGNIMCSYQRVNNSYGCANSKTLNGLLKTELGFQV
jgi:beta-glucosidase